MIFVGAVHPGNEPLPLPADWPGWLAIFIIAFIVLAVLSRWFKS